MVVEVEAVYEDGVLRPLEPLALAGGQRVRLKVDDRGMPRPRAVDTGVVVDRRQEMEWLATQSAPYAGQHVALSGSVVVAHGFDAPAVRAAARASGVERPFFVQVPAKDEPPFGGW